MKPPDYRTTSKPMDERETVDDEMARWAKALAGLGEVGFIATPEQMSLVIERMRELGLLEDEDE